MLRLLSVLLVVGGLVVAGVGGAALLERYAPREMTVETSLPGPAAESAPAPEPETAAVAAAEPEAAAEPLPAEPIGNARMAAPAEAAPDAVVETESAAIEDETNFNFQAQMEEGPVALTPADREILAKVAEGPPGAPSFVDTLKTVPVAHETPRSAEYKRAFDVTFAIDATGDTTAADAMPGRGVIEEGEAKVSERVEVRVSGAAFNIVAASPPIQTLSPMTENIWRWSVTPLTAGEHDLVFEVFAIDSDAVTPLRTFQDTVTVKVSGINRAIAFADQANPLFVLLGGLGSALAGLVGAIRFFGKK